MKEVQKERKKLKLVSCILFLTTAFFNDHEFISFSSREYYSLNHLWMGQDNEVYLCWEGEYIQVTKVNTVMKATVQYERAYLCCGEWRCYTIGNKSLILCTHSDTPGLLSSSALTLLLESCQNHKCRLS